MEEESIIILKFFGLITNIEKSQKKYNMPQEKIDKEFRLKKIDEIRNYLIEETNRDELISTNHKKICIVLNYSSYFFVVTYTIAGCVSIFAFASLVDIPIGITSSANGLEICAIISGIKKYQSIIKKKEKKHDKIVLLAKSKLNSMEVLISAALIDSVVNHIMFKYMRIMF